MRLINVSIIFSILLAKPISSYVNNASQTNPDSPLFLTPLIRQQKINESRNAARVSLAGFGNVRSYSGYLTVDEQFNSNLFFWFFPSCSNYKNDPVILWLQGGPGTSSLMGVFLQNGPFVVTPRQAAKLRKVTWTKNHSVLYIDNPVGAGFSFTNPDGYSRNGTAVANNLYSALLQFFRLFPELQKNDLFVCGTSYGAKFVIAVSYVIYKNNLISKQIINLKGLSIGNGFIDPEHQLNYGPLLYTLGLIDAKQKKVIDKHERQTIEYIQNKQWILAFKAFEQLIFGYYFNKTTLLKNETGFDNYLNYLNENTIPMDYLREFIESSDFRAAIHVGNVTFNGMENVAQNLAVDFMQSVAPWLSELLNHFPVLVYTGQLDIMSAHSMLMDFLNNFEFSGAHEYKIALRKKWFVEGCLAGYVKQAGNLTEVLVSNAGHTVPQDQPLWAFDLITKFTHNEVFY